MSIHCFWGLRALVDWARSISDYPNPAVEWRIEYVDTGIQEEMIQKEDLEQGWAIAGPRAIVDPQLEYKSDKITIACRINNCLIKRV